MFPCKVVITVSFGSYESGRLSVESTKDGIALRSESIGTVDPCRMAAEAIERHLKKFESDDAIVHCEQCRGRLDRPGLYGCKAKGHPIADLAQRIAARIHSEPIRAAYGITPESARYETLDEWAKVIRDELAKDAH